MLKRWLESNLECNKRQRLEDGGVYAHLLALENVLSYLKVVNWIDLTFVNKTLANIFMGTDSPYRKLFHHLKTHPSQLLPDSSDAFPHDKPWIAIPRLIGLADYQRFWQHLLEARPFRLLELFFIYYFGDEEPTRVSVERTKTPQGLQRKETITIERKFFQHPTFDSRLRGRFILLGKRFRYVAPWGQLKHKPFIEERAVQEMCSHFINCVLAEITGYDDYYSVDEDYQVHLWRAATVKIIAEQFKINVRAEFAQ